MRDAFHGSGRGRLLGLLAAAAFAIAGAVIVRSLWSIRPPRVTISAGNTEGMWHRFVAKFAVLAADHIDLEPVVTAGTLDMLERVDTGELDFALIQGGYDIERFGNVRQVAGLSVQPVHLLVKEEIHPAVAGDLGALRRRTINLGSGTRTGMYWLSRDILGFAGLSPADYQASALTSEQLRSEHDRTRLPDAVFIATTPPSELVRQLVVQFHFRLVPLPFGDAFRLGALDVDRPSPPAAIQVRKEHIADAVIPADVYQLSPPVPPRPIPTLGTRVLLITHRRTASATVVTLLDTLLKSRYAKAVQPPLDAGVVDLAPEAPWHPGAIEYRGRDQPLITAESISFLSNSLQIFLPLAGGIILLWGWLRNRVLVRRERRFDRFIYLVSGVEKRGLALEASGTYDHHAVRKLHKELCTIKDAALESIARGESSEATLVSSLFAHIHDVRIYLAEVDRGCSSDESGVGQP
jgi:TRAP-type uncharacterized transport system substrate-binding protein